MKKVDLNEKFEGEQDDALEFYMKKCVRLEQEVEQLRELLVKYEWMMEEKD